MKRLILVIMVALTFPVARHADAATEISVDFFYENLGDDGNWLDVGDYGYCWQPSIAVSNRSWRPYSDGYWAYTDVGWTWVSYEDFGWATYHYGRWMRLRGRGWVWVPGREWGPAWVSWRTGGDYVGWAPLPPGRAGEYWDEQPITARVDIDFDIGPAYYNFIDVRYIGEPVLRERIFAPEQNVTCIAKTVNVTNITYHNATVYGYGPDINTLSRYSARPIQRLSLQRETTADPAAAVQSRSLMKVQGDKLMVAAPQQFQKPTKPAAPKVVKEKIAQAPVERGWEPVGDQKAQADLKQKIAREDPKAIAPSSASATNSTATVSPVTTPAPPRDAGKHNQRENAAPSASVPSISAPAESTPMPRKGPKDKPKKENNTPATSRSNTLGSSAPAPIAPPPQQDNKRNKRLPETTPPYAVPEKPKHEMTTDGPAKALGKERGAERSMPNAPANQPPARDDGKKQKKNDKSEPPTGPSL